MQIMLPYGRASIVYEASASRVITSGINQLAPAGDGQMIVQRAMAEPYGGQTLAALAAGKKSACIIISDHTRPVPSQDILPPMLRELRMGNPDIDVTLLVATGCHRSTTPAELRQKLGSIADEEKTVIHDAFDLTKNVFLGTLPSGAPLLIDRCAAETELLISEGFIEPHFFAGFSGGRKSVLPGICASQTVYANHCSAFIDSPYARTGVLEGNPIHLDMLAAAHMAKLQYLVNAVIDAKHRTVAAFAGDFELAHAAGVAFLRSHCMVHPIPGDVVITTNGGAPLDQNLYQCVKALTAAEATARPGADIILCAEMADGIGGDQFYHDMIACENPSALYRKYLQTPQAETHADQWQTQILCRILMHHRVIVVTRPQMQSVIEAMKMCYAPDLQTALSMTNGGDITVVPDGVSVWIQSNSRTELP